MADVDRGAQITNEATQVFNLLQSDPKAASDRLTADMQSGQLDQREAAQLRSTVRDYEANDIIALLKDDPKNAADWLKYYLTRDESLDAHEGSKLERTVRDNQDPNGQGLLYVADPVFTACDQPGSAEVDVQFNNDQGQASQVFINNIEVKAPDCQQQQVPGGPQYDGAVPPPGYPPYGTDPGYGYGTDYGYGNYGMIDPLDDGYYMGAYFPISPGIGMYRWGHNQGFRQQQQHITQQYWQQTVPGYTPGQTYTRTGTGSPEITTPIQNNTTNYYKSVTKNITVEPTQRQPQPTERQPGTGNNPGDRRPGNGITPGGPDRRPEPIQPNPNRTPVDRQPQLEPKPVVPPPKLPTSTPGDRRQTGPVGQDPRFHKPEPAPPLTQPQPGRQQRQDLPPAGPPKQLPERHIVPAGPPPGPPPRPVERHIEPAGPPPGPPPRPVERHIEPAGPPPRPVEQRAPVQHEVRPAAPPPRPAAPPPARIQPPKK